MKEIKEENREMKKQFRDERKKWKGEDGNNDDKDKNEDEKEDNWITLFKLIKIKGLPYEASYLLVYRLRRSILGDGWGVGVFLLTDRQVRTKFRIPRLTK